MRTLLYYSPGACSLAPHVLLEEAGMPYQLVEVNVMQGKTQEPAFLALNPKGRVPVLAVGEEILTEVPAICWYIGAAASGLIPDEPLQRARLLEWFNWLSGTLHAVAFGGKWRPQRFVADAGLFRAVQARADRNLDDGFAHIEERLKGTRFAVGDSFSIVDPYLLVFHDWARAIGIDTGRDYPHWAAHAARMAERPAVQRARRQEGLPD